MGTTALVIELIMAALQHATELSNLLKTAGAEGRDVTDEEVANLRAKAAASIDALEAQIRGE